MNVTGIIGSGFGLYGYLPAVIRAGCKSIILPSRYKVKFSSRPELQKYADYIHWVADDRIMFETVGTIIVALPPKYQEILVKKLIHYKNITHLILEKPLAISPDESSQLLGELLLSKKYFRLGYNFRFTNWAKHISELLKDNNKNRFNHLTISWNFLAPHYEKQKISWKCFDSSGGGAIRFYGIHILAYLSELGYSDVLFSKKIGLHPDETSDWVAIFSGDGLPICNVLVNTQSKITTFSALLSKDDKVIYESDISSPFDSDEHKNSNLLVIEDGRVSYLTDLYKSLFDKNEKSHHWYLNTIKIWKAAEDKTFLNAETIESFRTLIAWPDYIVFFGGGRWARVLLDSICRMAPESLRILVISPTNYIAMREWVSSSDLYSRLEVSHQYPKYVIEKKCVVIIANAAKDHTKAIEWALLNELPVLVEKPATTSFFLTESMINFAKIQKTFFGTAHVFLFASYIEEFSKLVSNEKNILSVRVIWTDDISQYRYGEKILYDSGVSIFQDCLPHIMSILGSCLSYQVASPKGIFFLENTAHIKLDLVLDLIPCEIEMARNHHSRNRIIEIKTVKRKLTCNFSSEPGVILINDIKVLHDDLNWNKRPKPLESMLSSFFQSVEGNIDSRLDSLIALRSNALTDKIAILYLDILSKFIMDELEKSSNDISNNLFYILSEILCKNDLDLAIPQQQKINYLYQNLKNLVSMSNEVSINNINETLNLIIKQGKKTKYLY